MARPRPLSGFPEWLPGQRLAELRVLDTLRRVYELYGYTSLETPAVERVEVLEAKGEVDKEIYALGRLREEPGQVRSWELGLHFDLTVPLARYVAQHQGSLSFPFKRHQIQKVWRGERPQEGRFREFYQADIDVIGEDRLPLAFDAEMPMVIHEVFERLGIRALIRVNHRKVLRGFYEAQGLSPEQIPVALREIDKLEKTGPDAVLASLSRLGLSDLQARACLRLAELRGPGARVIPAARGLGASHPLMEEGLAELETVERELAHLPPEALIFDLGIVRGLDYYTGIIYETVLPGHPALGSVCSGGRYDNLASEFTSRRLPGVGISVGVSRLVAHLLSLGALDVSRQTTTRILVTWPEGGPRGRCQEIARQLRGAGIPTEVYHEPAALKRQIRYADRKGIPWVLFPHRWTPDLQIVEVKELVSGEQQELDLPTWIRRLAARPGH